MHFICDEKKLCPHFILYVVHMGKGFHVAAAILTDAPLWANMGF